MSARSEDGDIAFAAFHIRQEAAVDAHPFGHGDEGFGLALQSAYDSSRRSARSTIGLQSMKRVRASRINELSD